MADAVATLRKLAPHAAPALVAAFGRTAALEKAGLNTPLRLAHFMAQVAVETNGFTALRESGNYRAARIVEVFGVGKHSAAVTPAEAKKLAGDQRALFERVYGLGNPKKAAELGNTKPGDGWRFRGGGGLHTTGRAAYERAGLDAAPELIETEYCLQPALDHWRDRGCNPLADTNNIREITRRVNGGYNGYDERVAWFNRLWPLLRKADAPAESWKAAQPAESTRILQQQLVQLGYPLKVDGRYGPKTAEAVTAFQKANGLRADGIAGPITEEAIRARLKGTAPAIGSAVVADKPGMAAPTATGLGIAALAEGGQRLIDQAGVLHAYAELSDWIAWGAAGLTVAGVAVIAIGVIRTYVLPAIWPARPAVPA
ncbi:putative chitinase [Ancylobacter sp. 3268]|uniref:peptidoglycan-binding protein n=1 Tax=Ancylobacter sp. 3268 TaxID=2817752 RepID=UPI00285DCF1D|nr:peptidoglycan-binding protein [Ancylobacter sp. 3268]MDR6952659.1 putative chitinase [Ancylobacter sp. 3268]